MWTLINRTPFATFSGFDRDKQGRSYWLVWAKATFRMRNQQTCLFERRQLDLFKGPLYRAEVGSSDLVADSDIGLPKMQTDVLLTGHAYRPISILKDEPFEVSASIGAWSKSLSIYPPMRWSDKLRAETAENDDAPVFLGFNNAYGGVDDEAEPDHPQQMFSNNPLGLGYATSEAGAKGKALPRLYAADAKPISRWDETAEPVAFSPIPKSWPQRAQYSGTYDQNWMRKKSPLLPDDLREEYWQSVPADQQLDQSPAKGTRITLTNMMPPDDIASYGPFTTELPTLQFELMTRFKGRWQETPMDLQTIHLFPDAGLVTLAYCGAMPLLSAANDVLVDRSELALRGHSGFRVLPEDADCFSGLGMEV